MMEDQQDYFELGAEHKHLALHSDEMLALATDGGAQIKVIDIQAKSLRWILKGLVSPVVDARFSPDGRRALSRSKDGTICLWNLENGEPLDTLDPLNEEISTINFRTDGQQFSVLRKDGAGRIYSTVDCSATTSFTTQFVEELGDVRILPGHHIEPVVVFTSNGLLLSIAKPDANKQYTLRVMDLMSNSCQNTHIYPKFMGAGSPFLSHEGWVTGYNHDCSRFVMLSRKHHVGTRALLYNFSLFNAKTGECLLATDHKFHLEICNGFSSDGFLFVFVCDNQAIVSNAVDGSSLHQLNIPNSYNVIDVAVDRKLLTFAFNNRDDALCYAVRSLPQLDEHRPQ